MRELSVDGLELLGALVRDGMQESFHHGVAVMVDPDGNLAFSKGDVFALIYPRSALKPIQASAMHQAGLELTAAQSVMTMASHYATPRQVELVAAILSVNGVAESALGCPEAMPWNAEAKVGATAAPILMNCSGKHAGFLAASQINGWDLGSYLNKSHPIQKLVKQTLESYSGEEIVKSSTDGCGAPLHALSTIGLARALSQFVKREPGLVQAALSNPELIGDLDTPDAAFLRLGLFSKLGAEGVFTVITPSGHSLAIKFADGSLRLALSYAATLLNRFGLISVEQMEIALASDKTEVKGGGKFLGGWELYF
jgi:L-asparaginase II